MPRYTIVRLLVLSLLTVLAIAVWSPQLATAAGPMSAHFKMELEYSPERLMRVQCDGDAVRLIVRVTRLSDGSPVAGAAVRTAAGETLTNGRGVARAAVVSNPGATRRTLWVGVDVEGESMLWLGDYSCPFPSGEFGLDVRAFIDKNGDGVVAPHEPGFVRREVKVGFVSSQSQASNLTPRLYALDRKGALSTTLDRAGYDLAGAVGFWALCLSDREVERGWQIVSANGATILDFSGCVRLPQLAPGENTFTIGVARTRPDEP